MMLTPMLSNEVLVCLRKINQSLDLQSRQLMREIGLTGPQFLILQAVCENAGLTAGAIARTVSLSQATVTGILERLVRRGLITRDRNDVDRRKVLIHLTDKGLETMGKTPTLLHRSFVDEFEALDDGEKTVIISTLRRLALMMDAGKNNTPPVLVGDPMVGDSMAQPDGDCPI